MTSTSLEDADPFADPAVEETDQRSFVLNSTLACGHDASLTLSNDSLIVLDEQLPEGRRFNCFGLIHQRTFPTRTIPYYNILWAELTRWEICIRYVHPISKSVFRVAYLNYSVEKASSVDAQSWVERLLDRAYGESQRRKRIKVLVNPFGGKGRAPKWYLRDIQPILAAARCDVDVERTQYKAHAVEIAEKIDVDSYDVIACCSGDGLPHEVINGLGRRRDAARALAQIAVVQLPCGTGNAMSWNLNGTDSPSLAALAVVKGLNTPLDLVSITQGNTRTLSFLSQALGVVADSDLGTERLRWMGSARFTCGFLVHLIRKDVYPCDLAVKVEILDKSDIREHYRHELGNRETEPLRRGKLLKDALPPLRYGSINDPLPEGWTLVPYETLGNFYAGNMAYMAADTNFFPASLPSDGCLDLVCIDGNISRRAALSLLLAVENGTFFNNEYVSYRKISGYRIVPRQTKGYISIDGESAPFMPFQAEVHRGLGTVLSRSGHVYEAPGVTSMEGDS